MGVIVALRFSSLFYLLAFCAAQDQNVQIPPAVQEVQQAQRQQQQQNAEGGGNFQANEPQSNQRPVNVNVPVSNEKQAGERHIVDYEECREDIHKYCVQPGLDIRSDMAVLQCLQDKKLSETELLTARCEHLIWEFKINLTQSDQFRQAVSTFCANEMNSNPEMAKCLHQMEPGYALSCFIDFITIIPKDTKCFQVLDGSARLAFSDFRVVAPFVAKCRNSIQRLKCGTLTPPSAHAKVRVPHTQGHTLECLISKMVKAQQIDSKTELMIDEECRHEVMRLAELQSEDFHLDRQLFFACRSDREKYCKEVVSGQGKVFECLLSHRTDPMMEPECSKLLGERATLLGQNFRMSHPLLGGCAEELKSYNCAPSAQFNGSPNFHLSWVLLCLENAAHVATNKFTETCRHEMVTHRKLMMNDFQLSPEVVIACGREVDAFCSPNGDIEAEGKTLHCLMKHAQERDETKRLGSQCMQALATVVKVADVGSNYKVDRVLYASCKKLIDGPCAMDANSEASTLTCLMKHVDVDMPQECEQRILEVQYFMARDWSLDPDLYQACHEDAVAKCSALPNWHYQGGNANNQPDPGPLVLACLYRSAYNEQNPLKPACATSVRRVLRTRAVRVNLMPDIEESCRDALSEYCSANVKPSEEMKCLQEHFEKDAFKQKHKSCSKAVTEFTKMMARDTALNQALTKACKPVIVKHCQQYVNEEIDNGDVMECLLTNKDQAEMTSKCRSFVNHYELITLRDYNFSYRFQHACTNDIKKYCNEDNTNKAEIIRCLSTVVIEHKILGTVDDLEKDCKKQLKTAYLQQEQVNFDDRSHMEEADPTLMKKCASELDRFQCRREKYFEDVVECLRINFEELGPECKAMVFYREEIEAADNRFDDELQRNCQPEIEKFCHLEDGARVLECLQNMKVVRILSTKCQKVVLERMREQAKDVRLNIGLLEACREEAEQYCPDDFKKINDPQYAKKTLEGVFVSCLRVQYADPQKSIHLNAKCKNEISNVILESEFDIQLDPLLYKACKNTISKHCANSVITQSGSYNSVLECLKTDFRQGVISDTSCAQQIARRLQESLVDLHLDPVLHEACAIDVQRLCYDVPPGQSRLIICLLDAMKSRSTQLSVNCREKLVERNNLWNKAHQEHAMPLPSSFAEMVNIVAQHPQRTSLLTWFGALVLVLFFLGCCCGRATKRIQRELKNR